jgi:hypothetical protein
MLATVVAGIRGLSVGPACEVQPLVAGLLFGTAAGVLALSLLRPATFLAGGVAGCLLGRAIMPAWDEPFIFFFVGGFLALLLLRFWIMAASSLAGTLILMHSLLLLLESLDQVEAVPWTSARLTLLDWGCGLLAVLGFALQWSLDRRSRRKKKEQKIQDEEPGSWFLAFWRRGSDSSDRKRRAA